MSHFTAATASRETKSFEKQQSCRLLAACGELVGGDEGSDLVFGPLCMKSSCVVPHWVFNGGTRMAHVFRGLLTLLGRRTGAGQRKSGEQCEAEAMM